MKFIYKGRIAVSVGPYPEVKPGEEITETRPHVIAILKKAHGMEVVKATPKKKVIKEDE